MVNIGGLDVDVQCLAIDAMVCMVMIDAAAFFRESSRIFPGHPEAVLIVTFIASTMLRYHNLTNRWTISVPLLVVAGLVAMRDHGMALIFSQSSSMSHWCSVGLTVMMAATIAFSIIVSLLFPPLQIPKPPMETDKHSVGVIDTFIPFQRHILDNELPEDDKEYGDMSSYKTQQDVAVRILYPTDAAPTPNVPYLRANNAALFCKETMAFGAPPPLRACDWLLHYWRLVRLSFTAPNAAVLRRSNTKLPIIVYSHGLGGNAEMYSYQTMSLAASGYVVVLVEHMDGSAAMVRRKDGSIAERNSTIIDLWHSGKAVEYVQGRRKMTHHRCKEFLSAVNWAKQLNTIDNVNGVDFRNVVNTDDLHFMGHSFGGATCLEASRRVKPKSIVSHDPATDWMSDSGRCAMFPKERWEGGEVNYDGETGGLDYDDDTDGTSKLLIHDRDLLILSSEEWIDKNWGSSHVLREMSRRKKLGTASGKSKQVIIQAAHHNEFSDSCMMTPLWLARAVKVTGNRSPLDTAKEIHLRTFEFFEMMRDGK